MTLTNSIIFQRGRYTTNQLSLALLLPARLFFPWEFYRGKHVGMWNGGSHHWRPLASPFALGCLRLAVEHCIDPGPRIGSQQFQTIWMPSCLLVHDFMCAFSSYLLADPILYIYIYLTYLSCVAHPFPYMQKVKPCIVPPGPLVPKWWWPPRKFPRFTSIDPKKWPHGQ